MPTPDQRPEIKFKMTRHHIDAVCDALKVSHGLVEPAARLLGMDGGNLRKYIRTHGKCRVVQLEAREKIKDKAESELFQLLNAHDWRAIQFTLLTLAKTRGYVLKDATLNTGDTHNVTTIQNVVVQSISSGEFIDPDDVSTIDNDVSGGEIVDDREPKKLN
jgi:hypothetical protein